MVKLEVLETTTMQTSTKNNDNDKSEDNTGKSKVWTKNFQKKILSLKARRERGITLTLMMISMIKTVQSVMPKVAHLELTTLRTTKVLSGSENRTRG